MPTGLVSPPVAPDLPPDPAEVVEPPPPVAGVVVVVVVVVEVSLSSSSVSCDSSAAREDWADDNDSLREVVSRVPRTCPAATCWPTVTGTDATCPDTWNEADASLTGSTVPTRSWLFAIDARTTLVMRYPEFPELLIAYAVAPPATRTISVMTVTTVIRRREPPRRLRATPR